MFTLPNLPFGADAFPDFCSAETFSYHHGKHHNAYVQKLNAAIEGGDYSDMTEEDFTQIIQKSSEEKNMAVFNNAAQHFNHSFFWNCFSENGGGAPTGILSEMIDRDFGGFEAFKKEFTEKSIGLFGSGWCWLVQNASGTLEIVQTNNAGTPLTTGKTPLLTLDVWEHAYYVDFRNARPAFVEAFFSVINWKFAEENMKG